MKKRNIIITISLLSIICVGIILIVRQMSTTTVQITDEHSLAGSIPVGSYVCSEVAERIDEDGSDNKGVLTTSYRACRYKEHVSVFSSTPASLYNLYHSIYADGSEYWSSEKNDRRSHNTGYYPIISE